MKLVVGALGSSPYMLRAFQRRSISQDSLARMAFMSAADGSSEVGLAVRDGLRSNRIGGEGGFGGWIGAGYGWVLWWWDEDRVSVARRSDRRSRYSSR